MRPCSSSRKCGLTATAAWLRFDDVSLTVCAGEIVGVAGVAGNGQRELAETIVGMRPATAGKVRVGGRSVRNGDPRAAIGAGVAYVPEDRLGTGVAPGLSVASNVVLKAYRKPPVSLGPMLRMRRIRELADACHRALRRTHVGPERSGLATVGRQPAEGRARAGVLRGAGRARRGGADSRARRCGHRDRAFVPARRCRGGEWRFC